MVSRHEVWLNGYPLSTISSKIRLTDISYAFSGLDSDTVQRSNTSGKLALSRRYDVSKVTVSLLVLEYSTLKRTEIVQHIARWAMQGGKLSCGDRPQQFLTVVCKNPPVVGSVQNWTDRLTIVFETEGLPFWQDDNYMKWEFSGSSVTGKIIDTGLIDGYPEIELKSTSGTITTLNFFVNNTEMHFSGLSIPAGQTFLLTHDPLTWVLKVTANGGSVYSTRTAESSDELRSKAGTMNDFIITANTTLSGVVRIRGLYI